MRTQKQSGRRHSQRGIAMAISLFALTAFILVVATSMLVGSADIRATRDYRRTAQVHFVAESGILHAIQVANQAAGIGVENFQNDVVDNWNTSWTPSTKTFTALPGFTYSVLALPNDANSGYFRATAFGPESATLRSPSHLPRRRVPPSRREPQFVVASPASTPPRQREFRFRGCDADGRGTPPATQAL